MNIVAELHGVVEWPARLKVEEAVVVVWNNPLTEGDDLREVDERRPVEVEHTPANGGRLGGAKSYLSARQDVSPFSGTANVPVFLMAGKEKVGQGDWKEREGLKEEVEEGER